MFMLAGRNGRNTLQGGPHVLADVARARRVTRLGITASLVVSAMFAVSSRASAQTTFRGCFASGPETNGVQEPAFDAAVDALAAALLGTGSWMAGNATKLPNGNRVSIEACVNAAKAASIPGDEFVFSFVGHGGDEFFPDAAEAGEGAGSDNHIRIGNTAGGAADRITDDQLAALLSGFRRSVTISVILESCFSHTFFDGANDLGSVTQVNGGPVLAGTHLALSASSSPDMPSCRLGYTTNIAQGITTGDADSDGDGVYTTQEVTDYAGGFSATGRRLCEGTTCPAPTEPQGPTYVGPDDCDHRFEVCPIVATVPEPATPLLVVTGMAVLAACVRGARRPSAQ
jgi:hypothetical protein